MTAVTAKFRDPFPPHLVRAERNMKGLRYGWMLGRSGRADFQIKRDDDSPDSVRAGAMVTLERADGHLTWAGFVTTRRAKLRDPMVTFQAHDHVGALFFKGRTAKDWEEIHLSSGVVIRRVLEEADARGHPPLMVQLGQCTGGPRVAYTAKAEKLTQFLGTMSKLGWEWSLRHEVTQASVVTNFCWQERVGRDWSGGIAFVEGKHFEDATLIEDTLASVTSTAAVGGSGTFRDRPGEEVNAEGTASGGFQATRGPVAAGAIRSPARAGTRLIIEPAVSNRDALSAMALALHDSTDFTPEALSLKLVESELDMSKIELGGIYLIRAPSLNWGLRYERRVRFKALSLGEDGVVDVEAEVLRAAAA